MLTLTHVLRNAAGLYYRPRGYGFAEVPLAQAYLMSRNEAWDRSRDLVCLAGGSFTAIAACDL